MKLVKQILSHAIFKLDEGEGFEKHQKYMIVFNYDESKEYCGLDGDIYARTYRDAIQKVYCWNGLL